MFTNIIDKFVDYQQTHLKHLKILSFSFNPNRSSLRDVNCLEVTGFVAGNGKTIRLCSVRDWLRHEGLVVKWEPIHGHRNKNALIAAFIKESALGEDFHAHECRGQIGRKFRVDLLEPSAALVSNGGRPQRKSAASSTPQAAAPASGGGEINTALVSARRGTPSPSTSPPSTEFDQATQRCLEIQLCHSVCSE